MATKYLTEPVLWKSYSDDTMFSAVGTPREPFIDKRDGTSKLRIFDGVTPGGRPVGGGLLNTINTPAILTPLDTATSISTTPILTASPYNAVSIGNHPHTSTRWQVARDELFTDLVYDSNESTVNLETIDLDTVLVTPLNFETTHYIRVRYTSSSGKVSEWSPITSFTTRRDGLEGIQQAKLLAADGASSDQFGYLVALSGDGLTAVVGARADDVNKGAAYVYIKSGSDWSQQAKLLASDGASGDYFGNAVAISTNGNTIVVGGHGDDSYRGAAYVFTRSGTIWSQQAKLTASDGASGDYFGSAADLASTGDMLIVSADMGTSGGAAYVFTRSGTIWSQQAKLTASDAASGDRFGRSVAIADDTLTIIVGATHNDDAGTSSGSAYVYLRSGSSWSQQAKLLASDGAASDYFGIAVAISNNGNVAIIGADGNNSGSAYLFTRTGVTWTQLVKVVPADGALDDSFGCSIAMIPAGTTVAIGASGSRAVYIYEDVNDVWVQQLKIQADDSVSGDYFGNSTAIAADGRSVLVGSFGADISRGAAYVFD